MHGVLRPAAALAAVPVLASLAAAETALDGGTVLLDPNEVPAAVVDAITCDDTARDVTRRPFAGGVIFALRCPGNNANYIEALVFAETAHAAGSIQIAGQKPCPFGIFARNS